MTLERRSSSSAITNLRAIHDRHLTSPTSERSARSPSKRDDSADSASDTGSPRRKVRRSLFSVNSTPLAPTLSNTTGPQTMASLSTNGSSHEAHTFQHEIPASPENQSVMSSPSSSTKNVVESTSSRRRGSVSMNDSHSNIAKPSLSLSSVSTKIGNNEHDGQEPQSASTASERRGSFSLSEDQDMAAISELKKTVSNELQRRQSIPTIQEHVPEHALYSGAATPIPEVPEESLPDEKDVVNSEHENRLKSSLAEETQSEHTEVGVSALEDEEASVLPAGVDDEAAVPGEQSLSLPVEEAPDAALSIDGQVDDRRAPAPANGGINAKHEAAWKRLSQVKAPTERLSTPPSASKLSPKPPTRSLATNGALKSSPATSSKPRPPPTKSQIGGATSSSSNKPSTASHNRSNPPTHPAPLSSHLTAPTASSSARHDADSKPSAASPIRTRRPLEGTSRLLAPTAASAAKKEAEPTFAPSSSVSGATRKPIALPKRDRTSMSQASTTATRKASASNAGSSLHPTNGTSTRTPGSRVTSTSSSTQPAGEGFLARMMRPTAATSSKTHDKGEMKSPPPPTTDRLGRAGSVRGRTNGAPAAGPPKRTGAQPKTGGLGTTRSAANGTIRMNAPAATNGSKRAAAKPTQTNGKARGGKDEGVQVSEPSATNGSQEPVKKFEMRGMETPDLEAGVIR